mgnify:CR=1 FL=1
MNGNRSIDTAQAYGNEEGVGQGNCKMRSPREELFNYHKDLDQQCRI